MFANTPEPPYYAVIFTSHKSGHEGYDATSERMLERVCKVERTYEFSS